MSKKIVIGLVGEKGSGKGTVAKHLMEKYGAEHFGTSKILRNTIKDLDLPVSRSNLSKLALILKQGFGLTIIIDSLINDIEKEGKSDILVADGIRMLEDVEPFRKKYGENFHLVYVTADVKIRYERTKVRKEKHGEDKATFEEFVEQETLLTEKTIHEIGKQADHVLNNNGTAEELKQQAEKIIEEVIK